MTTAAPLNAEQVNALLKEDVTDLSKGDLLQILRFLVRGQFDLEGKARQLRSTVSRIGR